MKAMITLFRNDMKRLFKNVVTGIIVIGLVLLPSIFSWYNILACWDVFDNTGNLTVAVANNDVGYKSDMVPLKVDMGEQVISALRENDQLNWKFTTEEDAVDGARSGRYYAAVVIPESFSRDMLTFYSSDIEHAQIVYYTNEKKSAVAPKVTDQGADQVSYQVNVVFTETLSELSLNLAAMMSSSLDESDVNNQLGQLVRHIDTMGTQLDQASNVLTTYAKIMDSSQSLVTGSAQLLGQAQASSSQVGQSAEQGRGAVGTIGDAMLASSQALSQALESSAQGYNGMEGSIDAAFDSAQTLTQESIDDLRSQATAVQQQTAQYQAIVIQLEALRDDPSTSASMAATLQVFIDQLNGAIDLQNQLSASLITAADKLSTGNTDIESDRSEIKQLVAQASQALKSAQGDYENDVKPSLDDLNVQVAQAVEQLDANAAKLTEATDALQGSAGSVAGQLVMARDRLQAGADELSDASAKLKDFSSQMSVALASNDMDQIKALLSSDTTQLAAALASPVQLDRIPVFPADNFGSQMAPLYATLALWIGSLLLVVAIRVNVSNEAQRDMGSPKLYQMFLGRFGIFAVMSLAQSTVMALGNLLFLGVQANHPLLYMLCFWLSGLVFTFIIYSMVVSFANLGKAFAVFFLIIQVTSGGGSFPLPVLPQFFQALSPYLPATHTISAMRAAMMGVYQNDFWIEMGLLLLFIIPFALLGLVLRKPLMKFLKWYVGKVEDSKLVA